MIQIRKTYKDINPLMLYDEIREFVQNQGAVVDKQKMETYSVPGDSSSFTYRGILIFKIMGKECIRAHIIGSDKNEIKLLLDIDEVLFPADKIKAMESDLDFIFST